MVDVPVVPVPVVVVTGGTVVVVVVGGASGDGIRNTMVLLVPVLSLWLLGTDTVTVSVVFTSWGARNAGIGAL